MMPRCKLNTVTSVVKGWAKVINMLPSIDELEDIVRALVNKLVKWELTNL